MGEPTINLRDLRDLPVSQPDAHSMTQYAPFVMVPPETLAALLDLAAAAHTVAPFLPPLHREALARYLSRFTGWEPA